MTYTSFRLGSVSTLPLLVVLALACGGSDDESSSQGGSGGDGGTAAAAGSGGEAGSGGVSGSAGATGGTAGAAAVGGSGGGPALGDPAQPGPFTVATTDANVQVPAVNSSFDTKCFHPEGDPGPFPLVTFAHGFQLPGSQYYLSATHLASFGFVVCVPEYEAGMFSPNHSNNAKEIVGVIDWAIEPSSPIGAMVDPQRIGATGHSLGGKVSVIAASMDPRIQAVLGIDPVDSATNCNPTNCPDASELLPLPIPTGFVGETTDADGGFQPCAPAADNFQTFYASAASPSLKVHVEGANHMSFLDDPSSCGLTCSFCNTPTRDHEQVVALLRSYLAAFFIRHLNEDASFDEYLTGAAAQQRYVQTGIATIESK